MPPLPVFSRRLALVAAYPLLLMKSIIELALAFFTSAAPAAKPVIVPQLAPSPLLFHTAPAAGRTLEAELIGTAPQSAAVVRRTRQAVEHVMEPGERGKIYHQFRFPDGVEVEFSDRPRRGSERAKRTRVVVHTGDQTADVEPAATFEAAGAAAGLAREAVVALKFVSGHEGGFDAINTWDSARFSWGFIQFAGGRGLPGLLGHMKSRNPERFAELLGKYGVDVLPDEDGDPVPAFVDPETGEVLRGKAAEQAFGDSPLTIAAFIHAARFPEIKQLQVEAAIEDYVEPALEFTWQGVPLGDVIRSPKSLALLIDRKVHEGNTRRIRRALDAVAGVSTALVPGVPAALEAQAMEQVVNDAVQRSDWMIRNRLLSIWTSDLPGPQ